MKGKAHTFQTDQKSSAAFTLTELLVLMSILVILALMVLPALARTQPNTRVAQCQHNLKQLAVAWQMYAEDHTGKIVPNNHGATTPLGRNWASGWLDWSVSTDNTNALLLIDARYAALAPYVTGTSNLFKCPADQYLSLVQRARGWSQRVRSYSANIYIGDGNASQGPTTAIYKQIRKTSEFLYPPPTLACVYVEEHPDSINDPAFFSPQQTSWIDWPATYHEGAANFAFADGRAELRKWRGSLTAGPAIRVGYAFPAFPPALAGDPDISWLSYRTPRVSSQAY